MIHHKTKLRDDNHYGVGHNDYGVLIQLGEEISIEPHYCQVRVALTLEEADHLIELIQRAKVKSVEYAAWLATANVEPTPAAEKSPVMELNIDPEWLKKMAEKEDGGCISVGGLVTRIAQEEAG